MAEKCEELTLKFEQADKEKNEMVVSSFRLDFQKKKFQKIKKLIFLEIKKKF